MSDLVNQSESRARIDQVCVWTTRLWLEQLKPNESNHTQNQCSSLLLHPTTKLHTGKHVDCRAARTVSSAPDPLLLRFASFGLTLQNAKPQLVFQWLQYLYRYPSETMAALACASFAPELITKGNHSDCKFWFQGSAFVRGRTGKRQFVAIHCC